MAAAQFGGQNQPNISLDEVLESIADAVLQICLFQVEAKENDSHLTHPDVGPMVSAVTMLSNLAKSKAAKWSETEEGDNKARMLAATEKLDQDLYEISKAVDVLKIDLFDKENKKKLLWSTRSAMQQTVLLLQLSDRYDIRKIIRAAKQCKVDNDNMRDCREVPRLNDVTRAYIFATVQVAKLVEARIKYIVDPVLQGQLEDANADLKKCPEELIKLVITALQNPGNDAIVYRRNTMAKKVEDCLTAIVETTKLSSQEMFAGIDLDLQPLDDDPDGDTEYANEPWRGAADRIAMAAQRVYENTLAQKAQEAALAARALKDHCMELLGHARDRPDLEGACSRVNEGLKNMLLAMRDAITTPSKATIESLAAAKSDLLLRAQELESGLSNERKPREEDTWDPTSQSAMAQLAALQAAVQRLDSPAAVAAAQKAIAALQAQAAECLRSDLSADRANEVRDAAARLQAVLQQLLGATNAALSNPHDAAVMRAFDAAIDEARRLASFFTDVLNPASANAAFTDPSVSFDESLARLNNALRGLQTAVDSRQLVDVQAALKEVNDSVTKQIMMARSLAANESDPARKAALLGGADKMAAALPELLEATKASMQNAGDAAAQARLARAQAAMQQIGRDMSNALKSPYDRSIDAAQEVARLLVDCDAAVKHSNKPAASVIASSIGVVVDVQSRSANDVAASIQNEAARRALLDAVARAQRAATALQASAPTAAETGAMSRAYLDNAEEARGATLRVAELVAAELSEAEAARNAALIASLQSELADNVRRGKAFEANAVLPVCTAKMAKQRMIADAHAGSADSAASAATLREASAALSAQQAKLNALGDAGITKGGVAKLEPIVADTSRANAQILSALGDYVEAAQELVWQSESGVAGLQFPITQAAQHDVAEVLTSLEAVAMLGKAASGAVADKARKAEITSAARQVEASVADIKKAWAKVVADPKDTRAQADLEVSLMDANSRGQGLCDVLRQGVSLVEQLDRNAAAFNKQCTGLEAAVKVGDRTGATRCGQSAVRRLAKQTELANRAATISADPALAKVARDEIAATHKLLPELEGSAIDAVKKLHDAGLQRALAGRVAESRVACAKLTDAAKTAALAEEKSIDNGGAKDQMRDAARDVALATADLDIDESTPKGRLNRMLQIIAQELRNLAIAAANNDKAGMIHAAQAIAKCVQGILVEAKAVGAGCSNKRLVDEMMQFAVGAKNHATGLKILAAVKSATDASDSTAENQLATASKNIAKCAISMVDASERCTIKGTHPTKLAKKHTETALFRPRLTWGS